MHARVRLYTAPAPFTVLQLLSLVVVMMLSALVYMVIDSQTPASPAYTYCLLSRLYGRAHGGPGPMPMVCPASRSRQDM